MKKVFHYYRAVERNGVLIAIDADGNKVENAKYVKVTHNGQLIHQNIEVEGPTSGARFSEEKPVGPLMIQGDHGPVAFRRIILKPIKLD